MKGYSPILNSDNKELNSRQSFIELGVNQINHNKNCECEKCTQSKED